jgi:hypothetical protein
MTRKQTEPTIEDAIEAKAADSAQFAVAFALIRLAEAVERQTNAHANIAESLATMAKTVRIRKT